MKPLERSPKIDRAIYRVGFIAAACAMALVAFIAWLWGVELRRSPQLAATAIAMLILGTGAFFTAAAVAIAALKKD